VNYSFKPVE